jgi:hypothetical protein
MGYPNREVHPIHEWGHFVVGVEHILVGYDSTYFRKNNRSTMVYKCLSFNELGF